MFQFDKHRRLDLTWQYLIELAGSAMTLALIVFAVFIVIRWTENGMFWGNDFKVYSVLPGGPAEQAGIQLDDRVLEIDGYAVGGWYLPVARWQPGDVLDVAVERNGQRLTLPLELARVSFQRRWRMFAPLIIAFSFWASGTLMSGPARQNTEVRLFRAFSQAGSVVLVTGNLSSVELIWAGRLFGISSGMLAPLILHLHLTLPGVELNRWRRQVLALAYACGAAVALFYVFAGTGSYWWRAGWTASSLRVVLIGALLGSLIWLVYSYWTNQLPQVRRRLRVVVLGTVWGFMPVLVLSLLPDVLGLAFIPYPFTMLFLALIPLAYWYAVMHLDLWRVDLVLNRSLVYLFVALIPVCVYFLLTRLLGRYVPSAVFSPELVGVLLLAVTGIAAVPLHDLIQRTVDRAFYGGWYDYRSIVSGVSQELAETLNRHTLETLLDRVVDTLWVRDAALMLSETPFTGRLVGRQAGDLFVDASSLSLKVDGVLSRYLCMLRRPIETQVLRQHLSVRDLEPSEKTFLDNDAIRWWVPMVSERGLVGLLLLGARLRGERFDLEDLQILDTLGNQAALAIRNILLVEELRLQLEQTENNRRTLERMHRKLLLGREEEQKRLSRELHDGPVQQLIALRYQLHECLGEVREGSELQRALHKLRGETSVLLDELRNLCSALRPPLLDAFGLASAIRSHCEQIGDRHGLEIQFVYDNDRWQLPEDISVTLFRVYQEAMSNVVRHANASQVVVELHKTELAVTLEVRDDGVGLIVPDSLNQFATEEHFGLLGIRERIDLLGGECNLVSQPGQGAALCVQLPLRS